MSHVSDINTVASIATGLGIGIHEHIAAFWIDDFQVYQWYLAVDEEIIPPQKLLLSFLKKMGNDEKLGFS